MVKHAALRVVVKGPIISGQFQKQIKTDFFHVAIFGFGIRTDFTPADIDQSAENAVQTFLRAYRAR
ncbi:TetR/AcrR family transcriptional regulator C-terminal domain-containing protein [Pararhizobium sp. IMCC21322]|uniref:TetR/AcrR family transcriptional regulator C-terminal domain-containing protein n=1 Tax=Pararhizobium sp. IMCC21322 TaxID=3067903 RepID=UPI003531D372